MCKKQVLSKQSVSTRFFFRVRKRVHAGRQAQNTQPTPHRRKARNVTTISLILRNAIGAPDSNLNIKHFPLAGLTRVNTAKKHFTDGIIGKSMKRGT